MIENNVLYRFAKKYVPQTARNHMRSTARLLLDIYAGLRGLDPRLATPDFLIIGAQKSGTTSLFNWLLETGLVQAPLIKEVSYFDSRIRWPIKYRGYFTTRQAGVLIGEATPRYLVYPEISERVHAVLGDGCKIIVVLRDPVERAVSHYFHERRLGFEKRDMYTAMIEEDGLIEEAFRSDTSVFRRNYILTHCSYVYRSSYSERLAPWFEQFGRENVMLVNSDEMFENPAETVESVAKFLGTTVKTATKYNARNQNPYIFDDRRVAAYLKARLRDEVDRFVGWDY